jgi:hypothetical protein
VTEPAAASERISPTRPVGAHARLAAAVQRRRLERAQAAGVLAFLAANAGVIVWLWVHGGNLDVHTTGEWLTSLARLTGLLSAYLALLQVLLLGADPRARARDRSRPPVGLAPLERPGLHRPRRRPRPPERLGVRGARPARLLR